MLKIKPRRINSDPSKIIDGQSLDEQITSIFHQILLEADALDDKRLRDLWRDAINLFSTTGDVNALYEITKWRRAVVPLDEFIFGKAYLDLERNEVYPGVIDALHDIDTDQYDEVVEKGALGIGKTFLANIGTARTIYKLSAMRSPQVTYGIAKHTPMVITIQSVRLSTARKVVFEELGRFIRNSQYFKTKFPFDPLITSEMIFREHNLRIMPVSSSGSAVISMNVVGGQLDEANFMQKVLKSKSSQADSQGSFDQAKQLYNTLASRRKSRFTHRKNLPGSLFLISSSRFPDDFTEVKAAEAEMQGGKDPGIYVFEGSQWSVKGRDKFSSEEFVVQVGNETFPSRVVPRGEKPAPGCEVIMVPMDFHSDFVRDVEGAIRDFAGQTTLSTKPFLTQRQKIAEANALALEHGYKNTLQIEEAEFSIGIPALVKANIRNDVQAERHCHIDLGISKDACGIAVGHIAGHKINRTIDEETKKETVEVLPVIAYDVILRIVPPMGGEIQLEDVRTFLKKLKTKYKLNITTVTFDGFNSADSRQLLAKAGFRTGYLSVEKIEPWRSFRDALYDGRVLLFGHNYLNKELAEAETSVHNNKERVDHRPSGTKDVADAVVGVAAWLLRRRVAWSAIRYSGGQTGLFLLGDRDNVIKPHGANSAPDRPTSTRRTIIRKRVVRK